jgi:MAF protein
MDQRSAPVLKELLKGYRIILASASPRRKELLSGLDIDFTVEVNSDIDENIEFDCPIFEMPERLSKLKSENFGRELRKDEILITADTLVFCDNEILGKPKNSQDAADMLCKLSGRSHNVITGITIRSTRKSASFSVLSTVYFKLLLKSEIDYYIDNYKPFDKAGAYGIQEWIGYTAIEKIEGSYFNIVGLPVQRLSENLRAFATTIK